MEDFTKDQAEEQIETIKANTEKAHRDATINNLEQQSKEADEAKDEFIKEIIKRNFCCNKWWETLTEDQKMWIHYYFYDISSIDAMKRFKEVDIELLHEGMVGV